MSNQTRHTPSRFLPPFLAAVCGLALAAPTLAQDAPFASGGMGEGDMDVKVSEHLTVDLHVQDEELANVLQILSLQSQKNILVSGDVSATVNANLYNVTFYEALESILNVNGYGYVEKGSFIYVYTLEEIAEIEQAARQPVTRVIRLNYLNANDAAEFVAPLLSEVGSIKSNGDVDSFTIPDGNPTGDETFALSSTLVIFDYPEHIDEIERLLVDLDTRPAQVLVEATILETSLREMNGFGIDFSFISDLEFTDFIDIGGPLSTTQGIINGGDGSAGGLSPGDNDAFSTTSAPGNTAAGPATFKLGVIDDNISFFLRALDDITDVTVLSRPKVMALNRQPARVLVGRRIGYLSTTSTETSTTQTVEFLDTGTQLKFRAFVGNDGFIRMELHPSTSTGETRDAAGASGAAVTIPEEVTQEITTNVLVRDGSTVVLGGLFRESTTLTRRQVPVLGDIPLLGAAFRGHDDDTRRSEIIFMITPTIVNDQILTETGEVAADYVENVRTGTRAGLLPWSRDRQSAELNVKAERAALEGDPAKGLFLLRRSLELNPNQPEAIRLREQLLQQQEYFPSRSIIEDVFDEELNQRVSSIESLPEHEARLAAEREALIEAQRLAAEREAALKAQRLADTPVETDFDEIGAADDSYDEFIAGPNPDETAELTLSLPPDQARFFTDPSGVQDDSFDANPEADFFEAEEYETADYNFDDEGNEFLDFPEQQSEAGDVFDTFIDENAEPTTANSTSNAVDKARAELENLRLTVTVAPNEADNYSYTQPSRTSVTLTPEQAAASDNPYIESIEDFTPQNDFNTSFDTNANQADAFQDDIAWDEFDAIEQDATGAAQGDFNESFIETLPGFTPNAATFDETDAEADAFDSEDSDFDWDAQSNASDDSDWFDESSSFNADTDLALTEDADSDFDEFSAPTGLIGPAYAGEAFGADGQPLPVMGGFWVWFRDSVVLDDEATDSDQAVADVDPDDND